MGIKDGAVVERAEQFSTAQETPHAFFISMDWRDNCEIFLCKLARVRSSKLRFSDTCM